MSSVNPLQNPQLLTDTCRELEFYAKKPAQDPTKERIIALCHEILGDKTAPVYAHTVARQRLQAFAQVAQVDQGIGGGNLGGNDKANDPQSLIDQFTDLLITEIVEFAAPTEDHEAPFEELPYQKLTTEEIMRQITADATKVKTSLTALQQHTNAERLLRRIIELTNGNAFSVRSDDLRKMLHSLQQLDLRHLPISAETVAIVKKLCPNLQILDLQGATFVQVVAEKDAAAMRDPAEEVLSVLATFGKLYKVSLAFCAVNDKAVSKLHTMQSLKCLNLLCTKITGKGLVLPLMLEALNVSSCHLQDEAVEVVSQMQALREFTATHSQLTWAKLRFSDTIEKVNFYNCDFLSVNVATALSNKPNLRVVNVKKTICSWATLQLSDAVEIVNFMYCTGLSDNVATALSNKPRLRVVNVGITNSSWATLQLSDAVEELDFYSCVNLSVRVVAAISNKPNLRILNTLETKISWANLRTLPTTRVARLE